VRNLIVQTPIGAVVPIEMVRDDKRLTVQVRVSDAP